MKSRTYTFSVVIIVFFSLTILQPIASINIKVYKDTEEVIILYSSEQDLEFIANSGCSIDRIFSVFNMILAYCTSDAIKQLNSPNISIFYNYNVSIGATVESFKVLSPVALSQDVQQYQEYVKIPVYWSWAVSRVSSDVVWSHLGERGSGSVIAVLDTGIDPTHPLLAGKLIGWIEFDSKGRPVCSTPHDTHGHGTWVASIAVGGDGVRYVFGTAPEAKIISALVLPGGSGTVAQVLAGLEWALDPYDCRGVKLGVKRPDVVSMSFGASGNYSNVFLPAIAKLIENGIIPVAAIGNSGPYTSSNPGNIWGVIGVGAINLDNNVAMFSSYEEVEWPDPPKTWSFKGGYPNRYMKPDIVAPGVDVPGAFPGGLIAIGSGTSAATPIVAGIVATISSRLRAQGFSGVSLVEKAYDILTSTTMIINHSGAGKGLVDAYLSVSSAKNMRITILGVDIHAYSARPLDRVMLSVEGIREGEKVDVYISGVKVYNGSIYSKPITVEVPITHISMNTVVVVDSRGLYYGKDFLYVIPRLSVDTVGFWGKKINIVVTGIGIGDTIGIYLGDNLLTLGFANLRGSYLSSLLVPYAEKGEYNLTVIDFSTPTVTLASTIVVRPYLDTNISTVTRTIIYNTTNTYILTAPPIAVNLKQYYTAGTLDFIDIAVYSATIENVSISAVYPLPVAVDIVNITSLLKDVYRLWIKIGPQVGQETYAIVNISLTRGGEVFPYMFTIKIVPKDPYKALQEDIEEVSHAVVQNITSIYTICSKLEDIENSINRLSRDINSMIMDIYILNTSAKSFTHRFNENIEKISRRVEYVMYIALSAIALAVVSVLVVAYLWRRAG